MPASCLHASQSAASGTTLGARPSAATRSCILCQAIVVIIANDGWGECMAKA